MGQKIKLSTMAEALGVSNRNGNRWPCADSPLVADTTRERIKEHAREIGYIYNRRAASLRTSRSGILGVVSARHHQPVLCEILGAIEDELDRSRQTFLLSNHYDQLEKQRNFIDTLLQLGADGVIMSPAIGTPASGHRHGRGKTVCPSCSSPDRWKGRTSRSFAATMPMASASPPPISSRSATRASR